MRIAKHVGFAGENSVLAQSQKEGNSAKMPKYKRKRDVTKHNLLCRENKRRNRIEAIRLLGGKCAHLECSETDNLHFDHIIREDKISHRIWAWSKTCRIAELAKCQLLCEYHHVEKSMAENRGEVPRWANYR